MNVTNAGNALPAFVQLESQAAAQGEIFLHSLPEGGHRPPPGHGNASVRNASRSTLV